MSWFTFWRRPSRGEKTQPDRGEPPATGVATAPSDVDAEEELTECGLDAFHTLFEAHRRALREGDQKKSEQLLDALRAFGTRPQFSASERAELTLALHHARNAAEARQDAAAVEALTSELTQWLGR